MVDVWLDAVTPKDSLLIYSLLPSLQEKGCRILVTAKKQTQTTEILDLLNVDYICVGEYGETLKDKLMAEQKRTLQFVDLFDKVDLPKVLWTHGDVSAIRTAFGLQIPIIYANDTPHAIHVAKLVCPLVNWLIAPTAFGKSWSKFGISRSKIALYDGVEEAAWLRDQSFEKPKFLEKLANKQPVVLFRNVEYKASYCKNVKVDTLRLLKELSKIATIIYLPRYKGEEEKLANLSNIWIPPKTVLAAQLIPYIDLTVGSGGTICRETALMGIPTINFHFWDAIAKYIYGKNFPVQLIRNTNRIIKTARKILEKPEKHKKNTQKMLRKIESPVRIYTQYVKSFLNQPP
jgi:predicted glycosyltransferase